VGDLYRYLKLWVAELVVYLVSKFLAKQSDLCNTGITATKDRHDYYVRFTVDQIPQLE